MCGIIGAVGGTSINVRQALEVIQRRGPDASSVEEFNGIVMGHNRLSIIDLAETANQPMTSSCGRYVIIFNGEIYNYRDIRTQINTGYAWKTHSDTEVILASYLKWGESCIDKLRGMFSFCIWDIREKTLFGARDRLGVKPFYYFHSGSKFFFGSRPEAVKAAAGGGHEEIDPQAVRLFLEAGYIPAPYSMYKNIKKLPPGHKLRFENGKLEIAPYWSLDQIEPDSSLANASEQDLVQSLENLVRDSVRLRMISDVPVGVFLSGGIDSSLVAAMMTQLSATKVSSFSIGFSDKDFDESKHAAAVAAHLGTNHHFQKFEADDLLKLMPDFLSQYDEPFFDYSAFPVMAVSKMARGHVKVALSGDGGDEAFGGYHYYKLMAIVDQIQRLPMALRKTCKTLLTRVPAHKAQLAAELLTVEGRPQSFAYLRSVIKDKKSILSKGLTENTFGMSELFARRAMKLSPHLSGAELGMRLDTAFTLPDDYLQKVDVGSMAFSLEARDPLLDHKIFEWAAKLPLNWKIQGSNKYLLRSLAYKYVPREILDRPKMGFGVPMASWLRGPLKEWAESLLNEKAGLAELGLNPSEVESLWQSHQSNMVQAHTTLWSILVLQAFTTKKQWS